MVIVSSMGERKLAINYKIMSQNKAFYANKKILKTNITNNCKTCIKKYAAQAMIMQKQTRLRDKKHRRVMQTILGPIKVFENKIRRRMITKFIRKWIKIM